MSIFISRIFQTVPLHCGAIITLSDQASHHLARVLRASVGDRLTLFNGEGGEYAAVITDITRKTVIAQIESYLAREVESPVDLCLAQGISRGEKMDYTIQKAVELGVNKIIPLLTERCNVKLDEERRLKRQQHWQSIAISACEQSGRNKVPDIAMPQSLMTWLPTVSSAHCFVLAPQAETRLQQVSVSKNAQIVLLIGPEGGLSDIEIHQACQQGFLALNLGPRVLRTETAAVAALTALQCYFGDMGSWDLD
jgi:16S rRNA (uracil1498-N3)-methyltransferase